MGFLGGFFRTGDDRRVNKQQLADFLPRRFSVDFVDFRD
jgi:hypothetical protein